MKNFNINNYIYIKIKKCGWDDLNKNVGSDYIEHCIKPYKVIIDGEDWYKLQMCQVFDLFPINFGFEPRFETTIMFDEEELF